MEQGLISAASFEAFLKGTASILRLAAVSLGALQPRPVRLGVHLRIAAYEKGAEEDDQMRQAP